MVNIFEGVGNKNEQSYIQRKAEEEAEKSKEMTEKNKELFKELQGRKVVNDEAMSVHRLEQASKFIEESSSHLKSKGLGVHIDGLA